MFYITLNIIIMVSLSLERFMDKKQTSRLQSHDVKRPEVQSYIDDELRPWSNGDPRFENVHPSFFEANKSCSYFPVSNIPAQGNNRGMCEK